MIKICHILDRLGVGGIEKTVVAISSHLKGYEHQIWCLKDRGPLAGEPENAGVGLKEFGFQGAITPGALGVFVGALKKERFDIIHAHGLYPSIIARLGAVGAGVPIRIVHAQSLYYGVPLRDRLKLRVLTCATTKVIAVSEAVRESLVNAIGMPPRLIEVIYNSSADMLAASPGAGRKAEEGPGPKSGFVACGIGRLEEFKGYAHLIEAVRICNERGADVKCVIAGDGPERKRLEAMALSPCLAGQVKFLGIIDDVASLLRSADVLVQPSTVREGLPLTLAEGASAGLPLIATRVGGNPEIVDDGNNGFIVPPSDPAAIAEKILFLARNSGESKRMGENSRRIWEERFSQERMLMKIDSLYRRCMENGRKGDR